MEKIIGKGRFIKLSNMGILDKDRKRLWAKSGNRCAICKHELFLSNKNNEDFNIGEECHIVSSQLKGPRHVDNYQDYDSYDNLILLCRNHHKEIDDKSNISIYTKEILHQIKDKHEKWVSESLMTNIPQKGIEVPILLFGKELFNILSASSGISPNNDDCKNEEEAEYIANIWQMLSDYIDIIPDLTVYDQKKLEWDLHYLLNEMSEKGYFLYGKTVTVPLKFMNNTEKLPMALLYIKSIPI